VLLDAHPGGGHRPAEGRTGKSAEREGSVEGGEDGSLEVPLHGQPVHVHRHVQHSIGKPDESKGECERAERGRQTHGHEPGGVTQGTHEDQWPAAQAGHDRARAHLGHDQPEHRAQQG